MLTESLRIPNTSALSARTVTERARLSLDILDFYFPLLTMILVAATLRAADI